MTRRQTNYRRLENLPGNPITSAAEKDVSPINIRGEVRVKSKKTGLAYHIRNIGNNLFDDLILPALQNLIADFFSQGARMLIFGENDRSRRSRRISSYNSQYRNLDRDRTDPRYSRRERPVNRSSRVVEVYEDIFFDRRDDAEEILARMKSNINEFGVATVGDLRSLSGLSSNITHEKYGWTNLRGVQVIFVSGEYLIDFPEVEYLN